MQAYGYKIIRRDFLLLPVFACLGQLVMAQGSMLPQYKPASAEIAERYRQAALLDSTARGTATRLSIVPNWQKDGSSFWYRNFLKDSVAEYIYADAATGKKRPAFDAQRLADALNKASGRPVTGKNLNINAMVFDDGGIKFRWGGQVWQCDLNNYSCTPVNAGDTANIFPRRNATAFTPFNRYSRRSGRGDSMSKDEQWVAYIKDCNVYMRPASGGGGEVQFTTDGTMQLPYGALQWSPDSKYCIGYRIDRKEDKEISYLLSSVPGTTRAQLRTRKYAQPGDEFTSYEMVVFDVASKKPVKVSAEKYDFLGMPSLTWNKSNSRYFTYEKADRATSASAS